MPVFRFHEHMIMVSHLTIRILDPVEPVSDLAKDFQPVFSIVSGPIDGLAPVSP